MKNITRISILVFAVLSFAFLGCVDKGELHLVIVPEYADSFDVEIKFLGGSTMVDKHRIDVTEKSYTLHPEDYTVYVTGYDSEWLGGLVPISSGTGNATVYSNEVTICTVTLSGI